MKYQNILSNIGTVSDKNCTQEKPKWDEKMCFVASILFVHVKPVKYTESAKDPNSYIIFLLLVISY